MALLKVCDKAIIQAQQKVVDAYPDVKPVLTSADVGPMLMRSVIDRMIAAESAPATAKAASAA